MSYKKIDVQAAMIQGIEEMTNRRDIDYNENRNHYVSYYSGAIYALEMLETWALKARKARKTTAKRAKEDALVYRNLFGKEDTRPSEMPPDL